ncbi:hypothetical protein PV11_05827 [Exophiala sideris]|uniref:N-acetylgalactosaminide beta-1,3-galactosyltransferase n=1 Tax=Exophiala sideris TaxID=1016849 RepID=A0A0D1ZAM4_9EURO|nr:hypothetical protein PV11_05827 [Exophiala sideris]
MPISMPRGVVVRVSIIFGIVLSLFMLRSYYLPSSPSYDDAVSTAKSWWTGSNPGGSDVFDIDVDRYSQLNHPADVDHQQHYDEEPHLSSEITDFADPVVPATVPHWVTAAPASKATPSPIPSSDYSIPACRQLPGADKVVIIVKTGATEVLARLPEQLLTLAECVPNLMIFSDMEQDVGHFHLHDALADIGEKWKNTHDDFKFYHDVHKTHAMHGDLTLLDSEKGWSLDKWKNIPMLHKAYEKYPDADWYMTIDADTYLGWTNLLLLLDRLNPEEPLYSGCVYWHGETMFAQGGTGYLLSRKAVQMWEAIRSQENIEKWEQETSGICCGDVMLGVSMQQAGIKVSGAWPMFQVDPPCDFSWSSDTWCVPAITWHHSHTYDIEALWDFEKEWINKTWHESDQPGSVPYMYKDAFEYFVTPNIAEKKTDWNNYSGDRIFTKPKKDHIKEDHDWDYKSDEEKQAMWDGWSESQKQSVKSPEECRAACEADNGCMQFSWHPGTCRHNWAIKVGHAEASKKKFTSGWMLDRVEKHKKNAGTCKQPKFRIDRG